MFAAGEERVEVRLLGYVPNSRFILRQLVRNVPAVEENLSERRSRSPVNMATVVDLPDPFGPSSPKICPGANVRLSWPTAEIPA